MECFVKKAEATDVELLSSAFIHHIELHPEYISHGEIQMGVGIAAQDAEGRFVGRPSADAKAKWHKYIVDKIHSQDATVFIALNEQDALMGFSVIDIEEDGDAPFGMLCDLLVLPDYRSNGVGALLMKNDFEWFAEKGIKDIYLESGKDNHAAHAFFEHRGFEHVSNIYKLT